MTFAILHRDRWRRQPPGPIAVDGNHFFARGLAAAVVPTSLQDVAKRLPLTLVNVTSGVGLHGRTWNFPGDGTQRVDVASPGYSLAAGFSFSGFALARSIGTSANNRQTLLNINFNGTTVPFNLNIGHTGVPGCGYFDGSGWRVSGITTDVRGDNRWHAVGGTARSGAQRFYMDGRLDASNAATGTNVASNANSISFGAYQNDNASLLGGIALGLFWAGVELDGAAMRALHEAPWQWARPVTRRVYFLGAGGGDTTATLTSTLAALTLSSEATVAAGPAATLTATLAALTLSSEATAAAGPTATLSATLGALTLAAEATASSGASATVAATLAPVTLASAAEAAAGPSATLSATLGPVTLASEATTVTGTLASLAGTLGALTLAANAETAAGPAATLAGTLGALTLAASAEVTEFVPSGDTEATVAVTLGALTLVSNAAVASPDPTLPRTRRIGPASLAAVPQRAVTLRSRRRIGRETLERRAA
jgi:hypothetical protein